MLGCLFINDQSEMRPKIIQIKHPYLELICRAHARSSSGTKANITISQLLCEGVLSLTHCNTIFSSGSKG